MSGGWGIYPQDDGTLVIMPRNDLREHDACNTNCPCWPMVEIVKGVVIITHHAFDFRDVVEWLSESEAK